MNDTEKLICWNNKDARFLKLLQLRLTQDLELNDKIHSYIIARI